MATKTYDIPIIYESCAIYTIEADTLQEAVEKALKQFLSEPDENYLCDSFQIDSILSDDYPDEDYNEHLALEKL